MEPSASLPSAPGVDAGESAIHRLDARAKIVGFIGLTVVVVSTPARVVWAFIIYAALLLFLIGLSHISLGRLFRRALVVAPFIVVVAVFLPFYHQTGSGGYDLGGVRVTSEALLVLWNAGAKAVLGVLGMIVLGTTTGVTGLVEGFARLRAPKVLLLIVSFMYRYSFVFADETRRMRRAAISRNYRARWLWNVPVLGHMLGSLFVRSYSRGERVYVAMLSRGYDGTIPLGAKASFGVAEAAFVSLLLGTAIAVRVAASFAGSG